jgi:predicted RNase H-like HicB family nuclease
MWQDICEEYGYEVERVPLENGRKKHETVAQYHARKGRELEAKEQELNERDTALTKEFLDAVGYVTNYEYDPESTTLEEVEKDLSDWRDGLVEQEAEIKRKNAEAKRTLADAKMTRSQATKNFKTSIKARSAYENLEEALQQYVDSLKDESSLEDWARRQKRRDGSSLYDKYLDDTKAERERKQKAFRNIVGHKSRAEMAEERFGDILKQYEKQYDDDNEWSL